MTKFLLSIIVVSFLSCSRDSDSSQTPTGIAYIQFVAGGTLIRMEGNRDSINANTPGVYADRVLKGLSVPTNRYRLFGFGGSDTFLYFTIEAGDSLRIGDYDLYNKLTGADFPQIIVHGKIYEGFNPDGSSKITLHVTRHSNGTLDGTFEGLLLWRETQNSTNIEPMEFTKGEFKNVAVHY